MESACNQQQYEQQEELNAAAAGAPGWASVTGVSDEALLAIEIPETALIPRADGHRAVAQPTSAAPSTESDE
jgi:hypothetical protein